MLCVHDMAWLSSCGKVGLIMVIKTGTTGIPMRRVVQVELVVWARTVVVWLACSSSPSGESGGQGKLHGISAGQRK